MQRALRKRRDVLAGEHLQLELERLDALQDDPKTIGAVLKIVDRRCELLGLLPTKGRRRETRRPTGGETATVVDPTELVAQAQGRGSGG